MKLAQTLSPENSQQILYMDNCDNKSLVVYENEELIWLCFDNVVQSAIHKTMPYRSALPHSYVMLLPLLHDVAPKTVLELGAGALSTQRYLKATHPEIDVLSVEANSKMIEVCRDHFPMFEQLNVLQADAFAFVDDSQQSDVQYDWIMVDLFYGADSPIHDNPAVFMSKLNHLLSSSGWLIINVLTKDEEKLAEMTRVLTQVISGNVSLFAVPEMQNHIFLVNKAMDFEFPEAIQQHNLA